MLVNDDFFPYCNFIQYKSSSIEHQSCKNSCFTVLKIKNKRSNVVNFDFNSFFFLILVTLIFAILLINNRKSRVTLTIFG